MPIRRVKRTIPNTCIDGGMVSIQCKASSACNCSGLDIFAKHVRLQTPQPVASVAPAHDALVKKCLVFDCLLTPAVQVSRPRTRVVIE